MHRPVQRKYATKVARGPCGGQGENLPRSIVKARPFQALSSPAAHHNNLLGIQRLLNQLVDLFFQVGLMPLDHVQIGLCDRVLCHKNRAAVLVGKNRSLIRADFLRNIHDLHLVTADQRP